MRNGMTREKIVSFVLYYSDRNMINNKKLIYLIGQYFVKIKYVNNVYHKHNKAFANSVY